MRALSYLRPADLGEALGLLRSEVEAKLLAGGQTLLPSLKLRLAAPSHVIDLQQIEELRGVTVTPTSVRVGAMTSHAQVAADPQILTALPVLAALAYGIGDRMVRNLGTIGGSVANSDPAADYPAALLGLNAVVITTARTIPAAEFFRGLYETALEPDEIIKAVEFPIPLRAAYHKFRNPASRFALVGVLVAETADGPRVAVTGAGAAVFRVPEYERSLAASFKPNAFKGISAKFSALNSDLHASALYRERLIPEIAERALATIAT